MDFDFRKFFILYSPKMWLLTFPLFTNALNLHFREKKLKNDSVNTNITLKFCKIELKNLDDHQRYINQEIIVNWNKEFI